MTINSTLAPGMIIANRFRLDRHLGQGGMGSVWAAWHITLNVEVAVKFIDPQYVSNRDAWSRFSQEAMAAAKIKSPHVVNVLDFGTDEAHRPYLAMELLQGEELATLLDRESTLPVPMVARIVNQACKGLARAHTARVIHRDIKPDNLFLCEDEEGFHLKILDFGIAKVGNVGVSTHRTGTGQVLGTPLYMSPEQAYGNRPVDHRSDLYSLAVVAYRCLTGTVPFASDGVGELIVAITTHPVPPPSRYRAGLPPALDAWFLKALAKAPEQRFRTAKEMTDAFAVACGFAPSADSTAQFTALNLADLAGPLSGPLSGPISGLVPSGEEASDVVPLVRRGSPSSPGAPPSSRRQAVTLQGTTSSFRDPLNLTSAPSNRLRWVLAGALCGVLGGGAGLLWFASQSPVPEPKTGVASAASVAPPVVSASAPPPATAAQPTASSPVISISALPPDSPRVPGTLPRPGLNAPPPTKTTAPKTTPTATAPAGNPTPRTTTPAPTKNDYGL